MSNFRGYARAQWAYDNMSPPDDGPSECPECEGSGVNKLVRGDRDDTCQCCDGHGYVDENGEPYDPKADQQAADDYADMRREERWMR